MLFIRGVGWGGVGLQRGGPSMINEILEQWGRVKAFKSLKVRKGHAFRYRKHKLCKISDTYSAIQGVQITKFPGGVPPHPPSFRMLPRLR